MNQNLRLLGQTPRLMSRNLRRSARRQTDICRYTTTKKSTLVEISPVMHNALQTNRPYRLDSQLCRSNCGSHEVATHQSLFLPHTVKSSRPKSYWYPGGFLSLRRLCLLAKSCYLGFVDTQCLVWILPFLLGVLLFFYPRHSCPYLQLDCAGLTSVFLFRAFTALDCAGLTSVLILTIFQVFISFTVFYFPSLH